MEQRWVTLGPAPWLSALPNFPRLGGKLCSASLSSGNPSCPSHLLWARCLRVAGQGLLHLSCHLSSLWAAPLPPPHCSGLLSLGSGCLALLMPVGAASSLSFSAHFSMLQPCPGVCRQGEASGCQQVKGGARLPAQGGAFSVLSLQNSSAFSLSPPSPFCPCLSLPASSLSCSYESSAEILPHTPRLTHFPTVSGSPASLADSMQQKLSCPRRRRQQSPSAM